MRAPREPRLVLEKGTGVDIHYIVIYVRCEGRRVRLATGYVCDPDKWDAGRQRVKQGSTVRSVRWNVVNANLWKQLEFVNDFVNRSVARGELDLSELKTSFNAAFKKTASEQSAEFFSMMDRYIAERSVERQWSPTYIKEWGRLRESLRRYRPDLRFSDFSPAFLAGYFADMAKTVCNEKMQNNWKKIREFARWAGRKSVGLHPDFETYEPKFTPSQREVMYLTKDELRSVISLDLSRYPGLSRVRDLFVFQCCTGLRFSDLKALRKSYFRPIAGGGVQVWLVTKKDAGEVWLDLCAYARAVWFKYRDEPTENGLAFNVGSDQVYNRFLKRIGAMAGIQGVWHGVKRHLGRSEDVIRKRSDLSSHMARRTFVTLLVNAGASWDMIALYTSHADVRAMSPYLTTTAESRRTIRDLMDDITEPGRENPVKVADNGVPVVVSEKEVLEKLV